MVECYECGYILLQSSSSLKSILQIGKSVSMRFSICKKSNGWMMIGLFFSFQYINKTSKLEIK